MSNEDSSSVESRDVSVAFNMLHPKVQQWIWRQQWQELRDIQELAIPDLIQGQNDVILSAATASGKTEAAFLPIVSHLAWKEMKPGEGFAALYISPLRALINDQFGRMESLCDELEIPVFKWHGDVSASVKARAKAKPEGIVLITPESLEALLTRNGVECGRFFSKLAYIVIDELHAFMDNPRGKQLQSLLCRIEQIAERPIPRVGLSATLADMSLAADFLRPLSSDSVRIRKSESTGQELKLQLRGYIEPPIKAEKATDEIADGAANDEDQSEAEGKTALRAICEHLFKTLRGSRNLIFAGSRQRVELVTAYLNDICETQHVPGEFLAHHGSLSRDYREDAEQRMKDERLPASIVCTTTLELGIDVGNIESVAQLGPGHTVAGMRQRLGRSGRRSGQPAILRIYNAEDQLTEDTHPCDALRPDTIQSIAMIELMLKRWNEPPNTGSLHLSTLMHQILALVCQQGGITAQYAWNTLVASGVFKNIDKELFTQLLKRMGHPEAKLLEQANDGTLLLGEEGEIITSRFDFFAVFETPEEFKVIHKGKEIGKLPMALPYKPGHLLIFGGRYWKVLEVNPQRHEILVDRSQGGIPPKFGGNFAPQSDVVVSEMKRIYSEVQIPAYLDKTAIQLLHEARKSFTHYGLNNLNIMPWQNGFLLFPWLGSKGQLSLQLMLMSHGLSANSQSIAISVEKCTADELNAILSKIAETPNPDSTALAALLLDKTKDKYDHYLDEILQAKNFASSYLDTSSVAQAARTLVTHCNNLNAHN